MSAKVVGWFLPSVEILAPERSLFLGSMCAFLHPQNMGCVMLANFLKASRALRIMLRAQRGGHTLALSSLFPTLDTKNPA